MLFLIYIYPKMYVSYRLRENKWFWFWFWFDLSLTMYVRYIVPRMAELRASQMGSRPAGSSWPPTGLFHGSAYASNEKASCTHHTHFIYSNYEFVSAVLRIRDVYPGSWFLPISDPGSKNSYKREGWKKFVIHFFVATNFTKCKIILFLNWLRKKFVPVFKEL